MNELSQTVKQLPETIEEKTAYVLFGSDALNAYRKKLKAIQEKFGISSEQYKQIQLENLLLFSMDIGNEMQKIEKANRNQYMVSDVDGKKHKDEIIHEMGFTDRQARDFQTLAKHPDVVRQVIQEAKENDRIVTRQDALNRIVPPKSHQQTLKEIEKQARAEHREFAEKKKDAVVNFKDIEKDQKNQRIIINRTNNTIKQAICTIGNINFISSADMNLMVDAMTEKESDWYSENLREGIKILNFILRKIEGREK